MIKEEWRPVVGFEGLYEVSNWGRVKSLSRTAYSRNPYIRILRERILKTRTTPGGRLVVFLYKEGISKTIPVHRLVAFAFPDICGKWFEGAEVDHINGTPTDNRAVNLRFVTHKSNMNNPITKQRISNTLKLYNMNNPSYTIKA